MINRVTDIKTAGNPQETLSDRDFLVQLADRIESTLAFIGARLDAVEKQADHIDVQVHEIGQFIDEHRPALARGLALMSAGSKLGAWRKAKDQTNG
jgi:hypothetical protein